MLSSLIPSKFLSQSMQARDRPLHGPPPSDPLSHLRFVLETLPGSRKYVFTPATRAEILSELYDAFCVNHPTLFLPASSSTLPSNQTLHQAQLASGFAGSGQSDPPYPGKVCSRTILRGESCFRCRLVFFSLLTDILTCLFAEIVASMRVASCAHNVSTLPITRTTMLASTSPSSPVVAVTVATKRLGKFKCNAHITPLLSHKKISQISLKSHPRVAQG